MTDFDPHGVIKKLAEAEWECPTCRGTGQVPGGAEDEPGALDKRFSCDNCNGTGRIIPFKALRVPCPCLSLLECGSDGINHWDDRDGCRRCYLLLRHTACQACHGGDWVPEPDVERACWRVLIFLAQLPDNPFGYVLPIKERAVLVAAELWLRGGAPMMAGFSQEG